MITEHDVIGWFVCGEITFDEAVQNLCCDFSYTLEGAEAVLEDRYLD